MEVSTGSFPHAVLRTALAIAGCLLLQGCASASIDEAVPSSAGGNAVASSSGPIDTATFPNLNVPPTPAAEQISDTEKTETTRALTEARQRATSGNTAAPQNQTADLRRLARSHGQDALKQIEVEP